MGKKNKKSSDSLNSTPNSSFSNFKVEKKQKASFSENKKKALKQGLDQIQQVTKPQKKSPNCFHESPQKNIKTPPHTKNAAQKDTDSQKSTGSSKKRKRNKKNKQNSTEGPLNSEKNSSPSGTEIAAQKPLSKRARRKLNKLQKQQTQDGFIPLNSTKQELNKNDTPEKKSGKTLLDVTQGTNLFDSGSDDESEEDSDVDVKDSNTSKKVKVAEEKSEKDSDDETDDESSDEDDSENDQRNVSKSAKDSSPKTKAGKGTKTLPQQTSEKAKPNLIDFGSDDDDDDDDDEEEESEESSEEDSDIPTNIVKQDQKKNNSKIINQNTPKNDKKKQPKGQDSLTSRSSNSKSSSSSAVLSITASSLGSEYDVRSNDSKSSGNNNKVSLKRKNESSDESDVEGKDFVDDEAEEGNETSDQEDEESEGEIVERPLKKAKFSPNEEKVGREESEEHKIFVARLPFDATEASLREALSGAGKITSVVIPPSREVEGQCRGFAFISFQDKQSLDRALELDNQAEVNGQTISIRQYNQDRPSGDRGGRGGRGGGRGRGFGGRGGGRDGNFRGGRGGGGGGNFRGGRGGGFRGNNRGGGGGFNRGRGGFGGGRGGGGFKKSFQPRNE